MAQFLNESEIKNDNVDDFDDEEKSGISWNQLLEFYFILDLVITITLIVLAVLWKEHKNMMGMFIFLAMLWLPNIICFFVSVCNNYDYAYLKPYRNWIAIRVLVLQFLLPGVILIMDGAAYFEGFPKFIHFY